MHVDNLWNPEEAIRFTEVGASCEAPDLLGLNTGPLEEQQALLLTELSFLPLFPLVGVLRFIFNYVYGCGGWDASECRCIRYGCQELNLGPLQEQKALFLSPISIPVLFSDTGSHVAQAGLKFYVTEVDFKILMRLRHAHFIHTIQSLAVNLLTSVTTGG